MRRRLAIAIIILSAAGLGIAGFSLAHKESFVSGSFCTIGETFNCDLVNKGPYSEIFGVPVALIGVLGYLFLAAAAYLHLRNPNDRGYLVFLFVAAAGGLGFSGYLTGIEAFVLHAWCILCLTSQTIMLLIFAAATALFVGRKPSERVS